MDNLKATARLAGIFLIPLYGYFCDRFGRRKVLIPSMLLFWVSGIISGFVTDFLTLIILRLITGVGTASFFLVGFTILGDLFEGDQRGYAIGFASTINMAFAILTPYLGGFLTTFSWRYTFISYAVAIPLFFVILFKLPETNPTTTLHSNNVKSTDRILASPKLIDSDEVIREGEPSKISRWPFVFISVIGICYFLTSFASTQLFLPYYIEEGLSQTPLYTGTILALRYVITTFVSFQMGWLMARVSKPVLLAVSFGSLAGGCLMYIPLPSYIALFSGTILIAISGGIMFAAYNAYVLDIAPIRYRGMLMSATQVSIKIGQTIGPNLGGAIYIVFQNQIRAPFFLGLWISISGILLMIPLIRFTQQTGKGLPESYIVRAENQNHPSKPTH